VRTPRPLSSVMDEETAYIPAGSFVGFLIETYGCHRFAACTRRTTTRRFTGSRSILLKKEWRVSIQGK
jgi:hypothetical protein